MARFRRSWELFKASWAMLREDRSLLIYPIVAGIGVMVLVALIGGPLLLTGVFDDTGDDITIAQVVALFAIYLVTYSVITFCNAAMVSVVMRRMSGMPDGPSGWSFAVSRFGSIVGYAAIAATVGVLLNLLSRRSDGASQVVGAIGGAAWSIATFLVVPVLVVEKIGPVEALKRSAGLLKRTWGEQIIGNIGLGLVSGLMVMGAVLVGISLVLLAAATGSDALVGFAIIVAVLIVGLVIAVSSALDTIYRSAVYRYATNQPIDDYDAAESIPAAFRVKA